MNKDRPGDLVARLLKGSKSYAKEVAESARKCEEVDLAIELKSEGASTLGDRKHTLTVSSYSPDMKPIIRRAKELGVAVITTEQ